SAKPPRFPLPWRVEPIEGRGFKVTDSNGQTLAYVYGHADKRDAETARVLTLDEARRIAADIAQLPELVKQCATLPCDLGSSSLGCARYIFATFGPGLSSHFLAPLLKFILLHLRLRPQHYFANPAVIRGLRFFAGHIPHFDFFFNKRG